MLKNFLDKTLSQTWVRSLFLFLLTCLVYHQVIFSYQRVDPDAEIILNIFQHTPDFLSYLESLFSYRAVDMQPIRDLSLWIDWRLFNDLQINTFVLQNILIWTLTCMGLFEILLLLHPDLSCKQTLFLVCLFAVYPLFNASLSWGMARKHLLCLLFITLATKDLLAGRYGRMNLWYLLSIFSQPIGILWPVFAGIFVFLRKRDRFYKFLPWSIGLGISLLIGAYLNYHYYESSPMFRAIYQSKTDDAFNLADKILAIGHYGFQLFLPYQQAFYYDLGHWSIWAGLLALGIFYLVYSGLKLPKQDLLIWGLFGALPLLVVLNAPETKYDTYLLLPAFALWMLLPHFLKRITLPDWVFTSLIIVWGTFTIWESKAWTSNEAFRERNFYRRPTCIGAISLARWNYRQEKSPASEVVQFMQDNHCIIGKTQMESNDFLVLQSDAMLYDSGPAVEDRLKLLNQLSQFHWYPALVKAALLIREDQVDEGLETMRKLSQVDLGMTKGATYLPFVDKIIHPACEERKDKVCLKITELFLKRRPLPYL